MSGEKRLMRSTSSVVYIEFMEQINKVSLLE